MATFTVYLHIDDDGRRPDPDAIREMLETVVDSAAEAANCDAWRYADLLAILEPAAGKLAAIWPPAMGDDGGSEALTAAERNRGARL
jgi:hypothetical protein